MYIVCDFTSLLDLFLLRHFRSSIVFTSASVQAQVSWCVRMRGQLFPQYVHIIKPMIVYEHEGEAVLLFFPSSSPDVHPCCHPVAPFTLYSIINRF